MHLNGEEKAFCILLLFVLLVGGVVLAESNLNSLAWPQRDVQSFSLHESGGTYRLLFCGHTFTLGYYVDWGQLHIKESSLVIEVGGYTLRLPLALEFSLF